MKCQICKKTITNIRSLSKHIRDHHNYISSKEYYDQYLKEELEEKCVICSNETRFINLGSGYKETCSHICGGILHRRNLSEDIDKDIKFRKKVSKNQENIWSERKENGDDLIIREKISTGKIKSNENMTPIERRNKFGWLNHVTREERFHHIENVMKKTGMVAFWKTATKDEKKEVIDKRIKTMIKNGNATPIEERDEVEVYYYQVRSLTEKTYSKYIDEINPKKLKRSRKDYSLDHIISICDGYLNGIEPCVIASKFNLQMLTVFENGSKGRKSWMKIEELLEKYNETSENKI